MPERGEYFANMSTTDITFYTIIIFIRLRMQMLFSILNLSFMRMHIILHCSILLRHIIYILKEWILMDNVLCLVYEEKCTLCGRQLLPVKSHLQCINEWQPKGHLHSFLFWFQRDCSVHSVCFSTWLTVQVTVVKLGRVGGGGCPSVQERSEKKCKLSMILCLSFLRKWAI